MAAYNTLTLKIVLITLAISSMVAAVGDDNQGCLSRSGLIGKLCPASMRELISLKEP